MQIINPKINIVYAADDNFAAFAGVSIYSLLYNNKKSESIHVYILDDHISEKNKNLLRETVNEFGRQISFWNVSEYLKKIRKTGARDWGGEGSLSTYARLFIGTLFSDTDVKRVLYIDSDTIVSGSVEELFVMDMAEYACAAVLDYISAGIRLIDGLKLTDKYYNAGVLLIDIDNWNQSKCQDRVLFHMAHIRASYPYVDQDIINAVLHEDIFTLPIQYNVFPYYIYFGFREVCYLYDLNEVNHYSYEHYKKNMNNRKPVVIHYTRTILGKPWEDGNHDKLSVYWDKYHALSAWKNEYNKKKYKADVITKIQYLGSIYLNKKLYLRIHRWFARYNMKKLQKEYAGKQSGREHYQGR